MRKEEVFVRVSSEKKARKLKELLEMFGERIYEPTLDRLKNGVVIDEYPFVHYNWEWNGIGSSPIDKTKVSLKELRNILAKEKLREGDVVVFGIGKTRYISEYNGFYDGLFCCSNYIRFDSDNQLTNGYFQDFIRYATEEEKALLEPKKELEVGKWYKHPKGSIFFITDLEDDNVLAYGINYRCEWCDECYWMNLHDYEDLAIFSEATPQEVEHALIKEAKRRYKVGDVIDQSEIYTPVVRKKTIIGIEEFRFGHINKDSIEVLTGICAETVFKNGKWAEVIQEPKSLEERVKELEDAVNRGIFGKFDGNGVLTCLDRINKR